VNVELEQALVDYLLGRLAEDERQRLEERLFDDDALDERLVATGDELIHLYLRGELAVADRPRFETYFLADDDHRERLHFMRQLLKTLERRAVPPRRGSVPLSLAVAAVVVAVGARLFATRGGDKPPPKTSANTGRPRAMPNVVASAASVAVAKEDPIVFIRLRVASAAAVRVHVSDKTRTLRLHVDVDEGTPSFDAVLRAADGREVWRGEDLSCPAGRPLVVDVPASLLASGSYALRILGEVMRDEAPSLLEYELEVARRPPIRPAPR
jgi:anti-sigma factor RsiW